jgi:hypothetical protein
MIHVTIVIDKHADSSVQIDEHVEHHTEDVGSISISLENANKRAMARAKAVLNADA